MTRLLTARLNPTLRKLVGSPVHLDPPIGVLFVSSCAIDDGTHSVDDSGQQKPVPFTFFHKHGLMALQAVVNGRSCPLVREEMGRVRVKGEVYEDVRRELFVVNWDALAAYSAPEDATDEFTLILAAGAGASVVERNPQGTRVEPIAAQWLWEQRAQREHEHLVKIAASAWCTACGRHFEDARARRGEMGSKTVARWCPACHNTRKKHRAQLRGCAAQDCDHFFEPRRNKFYCSQACDKRDKYRLLTTRDIAAHASG